MEAKYVALELAKKIVNIAHDENLDITNLQLQKVMYYIQGQFMNEFGYRAFKEDILCWDYGPVVESVWKKFNKFGRYPIFQKFETNIQLNSKELLIIKKVLHEKLNMNIWDLVDETHSELPWKHAFESGHSIISNRDMEKYFVK